MRESKWYVRVYSAVVLCFIAFGSSFAVDIRQRGYRGQHFSADSVSKLEHRSIQDEVDEGGIPRINMPPVMQLDESAATDRYSTYPSRNADFDRPSSYPIRENPEDSNRRFDTLARNNQKFRDLRNAPVIINGFNSGRYSPAPLIPRDLHFPPRSNNLDRRDIHRDPILPTRYSPGPLTPRDLHLPPRSNELDRRDRYQDSFLPSRSHHPSPTPNHVLPPLRDTGFQDRDRNRNLDFGRQQPPLQNRGDRHLRPNDFDRPRPPFNDLPPPPILSRTSGPLPPVRDELQPGFGNPPRFDDLHRNLRDLPPPLDPRNMLNPNRRHLPPPLDPRNNLNPDRRHDLLPPLDPRNNLNPDRRLDSPPGFRNGLNEPRPPFQPQFSGLRDDRPRPDLNNQQLPFGPHPRPGFDPIRSLPPPRDFDRNRELLPTPRDRPAFPFHLGQNRNVYNSFLGDRERRH